MVRVVIYLILILSIATVGWQAFRLYRQKTALQKDFDKIIAQVEPLKKENGEILSEIEYFKNPNNLEKELRARFNYAAAGEKMIIVVPKKSQ